MLTGASLRKYSMISKSLIAPSHFTLFPSGLGSQYLKHVSGLTSITPTALNLKQTFFYQNSEKSVELEIKNC